MHRSARLFAVLVLVAGCTSAPTPTPSSVTTPTPTSVPTPTPTEIPPPSASPTSASPAGGIEAELAAPGTLTACLTLLGPPTAELDASGEPVGYNISFADEIADRLGLRISYLQTTFDQLIELVETHACDVSVNSQNITA